MSNRSFVGQVKQHRSGRGPVFSAAGVDRISELPEGVIIHILSLLPFTEDRIRTEVLSRRWKDLWIFVPNLDFKWNYGFEPDDPEGYEDEVYSEVDNFVDRVDKTLDRILSSSSGTKVKKFRVKMPYFDDYSLSVDDWVSFAERNETEEFELDFMTQEGAGYSYELPSDIYTNSYVRQLRFNYCDFVYCKTVSWDSLKKLNIESSDFHDEALEKIVAGTPALEFLDLKLDQGISKLDFSNSVALKKLVLHIRDWDSSKKKEAAFEIKAPSVESLKVSGWFRTCKMVDMASLVEANLFGMPVERDSGYPILTQEVVTSLSNVKTLTVGTWVIQGIATLPTNDGRPLFPECKCLTIYTHPWKVDPSAIARLLKNTPQVETLIVNISTGVYEFFQDSPSGHGKSNVDQFWTSQEMASNYLTSLRTVKFTGFWTYRTFALPFVQFVLKNATRLQKVVTDLEPKYIFHRITQTELLETFQKLLSYPRSSPDAKFSINP